MKEGWGGHTALFYLNERGERRLFTYAKLLHDVEKISAALRGMGISKGDRVTVYMPTCPEAIMLMLAVVRIGAIHSVVFAGFGEKALGDRIQASGSRLVFTADGTWLGDRPSANLGSPRSPSGGGSVPLAGRAASSDVSSVAQASTPCSAPTAATASCSMRDWACRGGPARRVSAASSASSSVPVGTWSVDLHRKILPNPALGPKDPEDNPFAPKNPNEANPEEEYKQRQIRRLETSGLTRDGVEVVPNVMVVFRLERLPGDEDVSFGYNPKSVEAWVRADSLSRQKASNDQKTGNDPKGGNGQKEGNGPKGGENQKESESPPSGKKKEKIPLEKLPAFLAVDVWREYLQKFTLSEMFLPPIAVEGNGETGLETILHMVQHRLTNFQLNELNSFGKPTGRVLHSREFEILQDCGIRVAAVILNNLRLSRMLSASWWMTGWLPGCSAPASKGSGW